MERDENTQDIIPCGGAFYMHLGRASGSISNCNSYWCHLTTLQTVSVGADIFDLCILSFSLLFFFPSCCTLHNTPEMYLDHFRSFTPLGFNSIRCSQIHNFFLWDSVVILWSTFYRSFFFFFHFFPCLSGISSPSKDLLPLYNYSPL